MSFGLDAQRMQLTVGSFFSDGARATLKHHHNASSGGAPIGTLQIATAAGIGASVIDVDAGSSSLKGVLPAGLVLTIGGVTYTVQAAVTASGDVFSSVSIAPALQAAVVDGTTVAVAKTVDADVPILQSDFDFRDMDDKLITSERRLIDILVEDATIIPVKGDVLVTGGRKLRIHEASPVDPGGEPGRYACLCGVPS
jgi:hypothetical protein